VTETGISPTRLAAPRAPRAVVRRPRLNARLEAHEGGAVLVSAPAGFGKTVLIVDWLAEQRGPVAWLSVDRSDDDPTRFNSHLAAAVANLDVPGADRAAALIRGSGISNGPLPAELTEAFAEMGTEPIIVVDDVHELAAPAVLAGLEALIHAPPPRPRLVLLSRIDPPLAIGRLRLSGALLELRERDLRFTASEAAELFDRLLPGVADASMVERLEQRTEGWVAGLRMAAIALQEADDPAAVVESFAGSHRFVVDYLLEEAIDRQTPAVQQFLMDTSVLRRFTAETCAAVMEDPGAAARLADVEAGNLFLVPLGDDRRWYRYHHLFAELLQFRLRRQCPERLDVLHRRASIWFEAEDDVHAALEHASLMAQSDRLLELLDVHALDLLSHSELATLQRWLGHVPDPLAQPYPMMLGTLGWLRVLTERSPDLGPVLHATAAALDRVPPEYDPARKLRATTQLAVLRAFAARYEGRLDEALEMSERVLAGLADDDAFIRGLATFNMSRVHMALAEMAPAAALLAAALEDNIRARNHYLVLAGLGQAAAVTAQTAGVGQASEELDAAVAFAQDHGLVGLPAYSTVLYHRGHVEYLADDLDAAGATFARAVDLGRRAGFPEGHANGLVGLARIAAVRRRFDEAESLLVEAGALATSRNTVLLDTTIDLERARLAFSRSLAGHGPPATPCHDQWYAPERGDHRWTAVLESRTMLAMWQAVRGQQWGEAAERADVLHRESEPRGRGPALCSAGLARALLPDRDSRWEDLEQTLRLAAARGYVRPVLDGGEPVRALLHAGLSRPLSTSTRAFARTLLDRFDAQDHGASPRQRTDLPEPLTEREEEVLGYLFDGLSNKAMARAMFVSVETVKTHLKHLYGKLGVTGRKNAVARARELGVSPRTGADRG
jgi:LuxR family transcriptional regulator, maltose regulon positive regulatory protein